MTNFKTSLPKAQYDKVFAQGAEAAKNGYERVPPYKNCRAEPAWLAGYDSACQHHVPWRNKKEVEAELRQVLMPLAREGSIIAEQQIETMDLKLRQDGEDIIFQICGQYACPIPWNYNVIEKVGAYFGSLLMVKDGEWSLEGCETCGHGSEYGYEIHIRNAKFRIRR